MGISCRVVLEKVRLFGRGEDKKPFRIREECLIWWPSMLWRDNGRAGIDQPRFVQWTVAIGMHGGLFPSEEENERGQHKRAVSKEAKPNHN